MKKLPLFLIIISSAFIFFSCSKRDNMAKEAASKKILLLGNGQEPESLDPAIATSVNAQRVIYALLEGLVVENPKSLKPEPGIAKSWKVSKDKKMWTFYLRKNAKWSNGDTVTAEDFVFSIKRALSPNIGAPNAYMLYVIKNAKAYNKGIIKDFYKVGIKAIDKYTLQITLNRPVPYFLSLITNLIWLPVNPKTILKYGKIDERGTSWTKPGNYVSNGPFKLKKWILNKEIYLVKNPYYWDAKNVKLNGVKFFPIGDAQTEERAFRSDQLHVTYTIPVNRIEWYLKNHPNLILITPYLGTYYILINVHDHILKNKKLRQALALSIDKEKLVKDVIKGGKKAAWSFTPPNTAGYNTGELGEYNIKKAKQLLAEAGYPNGKGVPSITITYNTSTRNRILFEAIQQMWRENLNINISLLNKEWKVYLNSLNNKNYQIAGASWIGDYNDPQTFLDLWVSNSGNNRAGWSNKEYDHLILEAEKCSNNKKRFALFKKAENILINDAPIIPLYYYTSLALIKPYVKGWYPNILDHHPLKFVSLKINSSRKR